MTLHAAITETLADAARGWFHATPGTPPYTAAGHTADPLECSACAEYGDVGAERVLAVLADRLPHTPPDQLAALIGGTVQPDWLPPKRYPDQGLAGTNDMWAAMRLVGPWVPPAAPEPRQDT